MARPSLILDLLIVMMIVLHVPFSAASSQAQDGWHTSSQAHTRGGGSRKMNATETPTLVSDQDTAAHNVHDDPDMLQPLFANHQQSFPRKHHDGNIDSAISRHLEFNILDSNESTRRRAQLSTDTSSINASLTTDKAAYFDGQRIKITYEVRQETTPGMSFISLIALFPHDTADYTNLRTWAYTDTMYGILTEKVELTTESLPALGKYKAVMAVANTNPLFILGVSNAFNVVQNNVTLETDETRYYEGELIDVSYSLTAWDDSFDPWFAWIGLFPHDAQDYSDPVALSSNPYIWKNPGIIRFSSSNLPTRNAKYKTVMAMTNSNPLRILGVSNSFEVILNAANLTTDENLYYEGEWIDITFTRSQDANNHEWRFAWVALFAHNVSDYSLPPAAIQFLGFGYLGSTATIPFSSRNLSYDRYKAVMAITDSDPLRILGVSDTFEVLQNSANLTTDETQYNEGELIDVTSL
ncbi:hypothetical protein MHU86_5829 [Fragilaria crotonensis]|nr:hypothetical protein MHU86_5829 [Fragilaria crotonensis]